MKALIFGGKGQLGRALAECCPKTALTLSYDHETFDITDRSSVARIIAEERPDLLFNAAAYTSVDKAESEEAVARAVNATAVGMLAELAHDIGARFVHVSTDFVFDGLARVPYPVDAPTSPLSAYGRTKREGELLAGPLALIVRTAWVYGPSGGNFVRTMLRLMAEQTEVRVVADQIGTPTYAPRLAETLWALAIHGATGLYHHTDSGVASCYDFAVAIQEEAFTVGLIKRKVPVIPISTEDHPSRARRPHFSVLDKSRTITALGAPMVHWRVNLRVMLEKVAIDG